MTGILDHVGITVSDFERSRAFYERALQPLGIAVMMEYHRNGSRGAGFGSNRPFFWVNVGAEQTRGNLHIAFTADSRAQVDAFHASAIAAGGRDNGPPGLRPHYHPAYYGAFVLDPDGHNIEAVSHGPE
jgi:catechol 2,3-dioxygenase-like lactoylglutathione lyase family enzyme